MIAISILMAIGEKELGKSEREMIKSWGMPEEAAGRNLRENAQLAMPPTKVVMMIRRMSAMAQIRTIAVMGLMVTISRVSKDRRDSQEHQRSLYSRMYG